MARTRGGIVTVALVALQIAGAFAYPQYWVQEKAGCLTHPTSQEEHHASPVVDKAIKYVVANNKKAAVSTLCPGASYTVQVSYPQPRLSLTTATIGTISDNKDCTNRFYVIKSNISPSTSFTWTVPCGARSGPATLKTTSAAGEYGQFKWNSITLNVDAGCKKC